MGGEIACWVVVDHGGDGGGDDAPRALGFAMPVSISGGEVVMVRLEERGNSDM
jgi:hypothetical protein